MFRVKLDNVASSRTCKPLYEFHQSTPHATFLDADLLTTDAAVQIYSGMVMTKSGPDEVELCDGATQKPFGLSALDRNNVIDDVTGMGVAPWAVWQGGPDAEFMISAPAFDDAAGAYAVPTNGTEFLLYAGTGSAKGKITSANAGGTATPIGQLLERVSATRIRIRLFSPR
jgi:hypothetical protein